MVQINGRPPRILGLLTARSGSKRLPGKNGLLLNGKPLLAYSVEAGNVSRFIDRLITSTDDPNLAQIAREHGADTPFLRPASLAQDTTTSEDVCIHALEWLRDFEGETYDYLCLLQPTSPFRTGAHIDEAFGLLFQNPQAQAIVSVTEPKKPPFLYRVSDSHGFVSPFMEKAEYNARSRDATRVLVLNGAIYIVEVATFLQNRSLYPERTLYYCMDQLASIDIDDPFDWEVARHFSTITSDHGQTNELKPPHEASRAQLYLK